MKAKTCYRIMEEIRAGVKPPQAETREEFIAKSSEPFSVPAATLALTCEYCDLFLGSSYLYFREFRGDHLLHESCWSERSKMSVEDYVAKQYGDGRQEQVELRRVTAAVDVKSFIDNLDVGRVFENLVSNMTTQKKKQVRKPPVPTPPPVQKPKLDDRRAKELTLLSKELAAKEAVTLAPVAVVVSTPERAEEEKAPEVTCNLCSELISTRYLLVKRSAGSDLRCHEICWEKSKEQEGVKKIYRYDSGGKCLEKLSFASQVVVAEPEPEPLLLQEVQEPVTVGSTVTEAEAPKQKEYRPSWREVDVHDYESLKKKEVPGDEERRRRRQAKKAAKAGKFVDLGPYQAQREKELIREGNKVWAQIFRAPPEEAAVKLEPRAEKEEPFVAAAIEVLEEPPPPRVELRADVPEFVPPARYLRCMSCNLRPCSIVNYPCYHVTFCERCAYLHNRCLVCGVQLPLIHYYY